MKNDRGAFLTATLSFIGVCLAMASYGIYTQFRDPSGLAYIQPLLPAWFPHLEILGVIIATIALAGMWSWKRWGVYLFFVLGAFVILFPFFKKVSLRPPIFPALVLIAGLGILFLAIYRKWELFK